MKTLVWRLQIAHPRDAARIADFMSDIALLARVSLVLRDAVVAGDLSHSEIEQDRFSKGEAVEGHFGARPVAHGLKQAADIDRYQ